MPTTTWRRSFGNGSSRRPDVSNVGHPKLVDTSQFHPAGQIEIDFQLVIGIRGDDKRPWLHGHQIILAHDPRHSLVVH
jgi:hypothetical protein